MFLEIQVLSVGMVTPVDATVEWICIVIPEYYDLPSEEGEMVYSLTGLLR